jgi:hypothetical protein
LLVNPFFESSKENGDIEIASEYRFCSLCDFWFLVLSLPVLVYLHSFSWVPHAVQFFVPVSIVSAVRRGHHVQKQQQQQQQQCFKWKMYLVIKENKTVFS